MGIGKKILFIYLLLITLNNIIKFNKVNYLHYLQDKKKTPFTFMHLILPSIIYKTKNGFYSTLFNNAVYEIFIDRDKRHKGYGIKMSKKLVKKYPLIICNDNTIEKFEEIYKKKKIDYKKIHHFLYKC